MGEDPGWPLSDHVTGVIALCALFCTFAQYGIDTIIVELRRIELRS